MGLGIGTGDEVEDKIPKHSALFPWFFVWQCPGIRSSDMLNMPHVRKLGFLLLPAFLCQHRDTIRVLAVICERSHHISFTLPNRTLLHNSTGRTGGPHPLIWARALRTSPVASQQTVIPSL